jgi:hypothetical protein
VFNAIMGAAVVREVAGEDAVAHRVLGAGADGGDAPGHDQQGERACQATHQRPQRDADVATPEDLTAGDERRQEPIRALADAIESRTDRGEDAYLGVAHPQLGHNVRVQHSHHLVLEMIDAMRDVAQMEHQNPFLFAGFPLGFRH